MSSAISSFGTLLKIGDGATSESFTTIAEVTDLGGPNLSLDTEEVTNHSSTDGWDEFIGTILRAGEVPFEVSFIPTNATHSYSAGLIKDMVNRTKRNFQLIFPNISSTTWSFAALVTKFDPKEPVKGRLSASITLKITGKPTLA
jgi:hypothetical protein